ncbi:MAG TPA: LysM domain-containing protein [Jiangellaceae bacterium]|nr:LysM domain-containing protein [Jiangellaceae bacterium]
MGTRRITLSAVLAVACGVGAWLLSRQTLATATTWDTQVGGVQALDHALSGLAACLGAVLLAWVGLALSIGVLATLPGVVGQVGLRALTWFTPRFLRGLLAWVLGLSSLTVPMLSATATPTETEVPTAGRAVLDPAANTGLPGPSRPGAGPQLSADVGTGLLDGVEPARDHDPPIPDPDARHRVVRPGDTLWTIAAEHLGGTPERAAVAAAWPRWYQANADLIGPDPNLIQPGLRLRVPQPY